MTTRVGPDDPALRAIAWRTATTVGTNARALHLRLLLQLPRIAEEHGTVSTGVATCEAAGLAERLPPATAWMISSRPELNSLRFSTVEAPVAQRICEEFHYLGSFRDGGDCYALVHADAHLAALAVTTPCDVDGLRRVSLAELDDPDPRVLARVFSFENAPANTLTRLFKLVCRAERARGTKSIVTYVNPNMGFTGSSYKAGNWRVIGDEPGTTYRYFDGKYTTDRALARLLGRTKVDEGSLIARLGARYERSRMPLAPLLIFGRHC